MSSEIDIGTLLADQLERLFASEISRQMRVALEERGELSARLWSEAEAMGVTLALVAESAGGAGLCWAQAEPVMRKLGQYAAPLPLGETMVGTWAAAAASMPVAAGPLAISTEKFVLDEHDRVSGSDSLVPWLGLAGSLLLLAERNGEQHLCLIDPDPAQSESRATYGRIPSAELQLHCARPVAIAAAPSIFDRAGFLPAVAALRSVQIAGVLTHVLALCVDYANSRVQFGKPIGKFQAIQHLLAELAGHTAAARVAGLFACRRIDSGAPEVGASVAKTRAGISATRGAAIAHQVFGAIGVTEEHELHYYTRRLWQWRAEGGSEQMWSERLGNRILAAGGAALWPLLTGGAPT
jgi:acyl-CoA dehydrogenase